MLKTPFTPWPNFTREEAEAVSAVLLSNRVNYWTGDLCRAFEREFAKWTGSTHAIALANGTVALDLALHGLGIGTANGGGASDEVIVTPRSFIASVSCVALAGAVPVFADVDRNSGNISAETIAPLLTERTKAIIVVHLAGWPADMEPIIALARARGLKVIEDCAQAHGARYEGRSVGVIGDVGVWSFCQDKIMTTGGEGGMVTCDDAALWSRMWSFKDHGKNWDAVYSLQHAPGFRWVHDSLGTNWRMLEMQAAIGRIQLTRMPAWTARRMRIAMRLRETLLSFKEAIRVPVPDGSTVHAYYRLYAYVKPEGLRPGWDRDRLVAEFVAQAVPLFQGSCSEIYLEKAFDGTGWRPKTPLPVAKELGKTSLMFLTHPTLTDAEIDVVCETAKSVFAEAVLR
ncbi:MAG: DegT/DnrJ/EryC1/StrS aminotransferase family protein [Alphaproteobacteria bacterium]|nr:MAG: DegT/DnrJ/EryC1/StrS aminotransferase family protein [Alphaproteobacteria bacterium]